MKPSWRVILPLGTQIERIPFLQDPLNAYSMAKLVLCLSFAGLVWYHFHRVAKKSLPLYDTFFRRFFALLVDAAIFTPVGVAADYLQLWSPMPYYKWISIATIIVLTAIQIVYRVVMHALFGQTLGKMACRVKVVDAASGSSITFRQALVREGLLWAFTLPVLAVSIYEIASVQDWHSTFSDPDSADRLRAWCVVASGVLAAWNFTDIIVCLQSKNYRALHDHIAGTISLNLDPAPVKPI